MMRATIIIKKKNPGAMRLAAGAEIGIGNARNIKFRDSRQG